jgi:predicted transposase/invertase (TIGR01784 family)
MMDIDLLLKGNNYTQLKESFVIFVCKEDFFGENMPCYFFTNTCRDKPDLQLGDKSYKVIFNASAFENEKNLEKKSILEYIIDKKSTSEFTTKLDTLVEQTKLNEIFKGDYMAWGLAEFDAEQRGKKEGYSAGVSDGIQQGEYKAKIETAKNLLAMGLSIENICKATDLSIEEVNLISSNIK